MLERHMDHFGVLWIWYKKYNRGIGDDGGNKDLDRITYNVNNLLHKNMSLGTKGNSTFERYFSLLQNLKANKAWGFDYHSEFMVNNCSHWMSWTIFQKQFGIIKKFMFLFYTPNICSLFTLILIFFLKMTFLFLLKVSIVIPDFFQISLNYFQKNNNKKEIWNWNDSSDRQVTCLLLNIF